MIRPTLAELFRILDIRLWHLIIAFLLYGLHNYLISFLTNLRTRKHMLAHEMPYLYDANMEKLIKERNSLRAENKKLQKEKQDFIDMTEGAKVALGVEK